MLPSRPWAHADDERNDPQETDERPTNILIHDPVEALKRVIGEQNPALQAARAGAERDTFHRWAACRRDRSGALDGAL
jgi:hypothetical protein